MSKKRRFIYDCVLALVVMVSAQICYDADVFCITDASITINLSSLPSISLNPGDFGSVTQTVSVITDNYTGYSVALNNPVSSTDLTKTGSNEVIPTIALPEGASSITSDQFVDGYGVSMNGTNYIPAPVGSSIVIGSSSSAGTSSSSLTFGIKPAIETESGIYSKVFVISAIANSPQYSITYNKNAGTDTVTNMPSNISVTPTSDPVITIANDVPIRSGYTFLGWDEDNTASTPTYATGNTNTIDLEPTQANAITLYAIWEAESEPVIADYTESFSDATGPTATATTDLTTNGSGMSPSEYVTKIFAYSNNTGRTITSISVEIVYSKANQGSTSGFLIGKLNVGGTEYTATPVAVARQRVTNAHLSVAQFNNLSIPSSNDISFTIGTDSDAFTAGITISSQTVTVTFAD